jgi:hypothetical protein
MNGLGAISWGVGLQDGLNPCIFMTCAVFIIHGLWLNGRGQASPLRSSARSIIWFRIVFGLVYVLGTFVFNFGPAQIFIFQKFFILFAKIFYFVLGVGAFVLGVLFFRDWFLLSRRLPAQDLAEKKIKPFTGNGLAVFLMTVILAVLLSAAATLWPINTYFVLLGNEAMIHGQWHTVITLLGGYVLSSLWPLWFVWLFLSIKNLRPALLKIFCAAIFFTASTSIIFIFR